LHQLRLAPQGGAQAAIPLPGGGEEATGAGGEGGAGAGGEGDAGAAGERPT